MGEIIRLPAATTVKRLLLRRSVHQQNKKQQIIEQMTQKEKAEKLVTDHYFKLTEPTDGFVYKGGVSWRKAIDCAFITVWEMKDVARFADREVKDIVNGLEDELHKIIWKMNKKKSSNDTTRI